MKLRFLGHAAFALELAGVRLCLDPHKPGVLAGRFRLPAIVGPFDALVHTHEHEDHCAWSPTWGTTTVLDRPQTWRGVAVDTRPAFHDRDGGAQMGLVRMVSLCADGVRVAHCGDLGAWDDADVTWLRGTDVLLVPAGGSYTLDGPQAAALADAVGARVTVPMHCADPRVNLPLHTVDAFVAAWRGSRWAGASLTSADLATISGTTVWIPPAP